MTVWTVSPAPAVPKISSSMPCFLKMPAFWPSAGTAPLQISSCPTATLNLSCASALDMDSTSAAPATHNVLNVFIAISSLWLSCVSAASRLDALGAARLAGAAVFAALTPSALSSRTDQYSDARFSAVGILPSAPAISASPGRIRVTLPSSAACI